VPYRARREERIFQVRLRGDANLEVRKPGPGAQDLAAAEASVAAIIEAVLLLERGQAHPGGRPFIRRALDTMPLGEVSPRIPESQLEHRPLRLRRKEAELLEPGGLPRLGEQHALLVERQEVSPRAQRRGSEEAGERVVRVETKAQDRGDLPCLVPDGAADDHDGVLAFGRGPHDVRAVAVRPEQDEFAHQHSAEVGPGRGRDLRPRQPIVVEQEAYSPRADDRAPAPRQVFGKAGEEVLGLQVGGRPDEVLARVP
jgi:hypothetical protein